MGLEQAIENLEKEINQLTEEINQNDEFVCIHCFCKSCEEVIIKNAETKNLSIIKLNEKSNLLEKIKLCQ